MSPADCADVDVLSIDGHSGVRWLALGALQFTALDAEMAARSSVDVLGGL
ncbi:MAG: hypothetical protein ACPGU1_02580 [Myxococcota bacterium]